MTLQPTTFLRRTLAVDALISGATGVLLLVGAGLLSPLLDVPVSLLRYAGVVLVPFALWVGLVARSPNVSRSSVLAIIGLNAAWVIGSAWLALGGAIQPNVLGYAFIVVQAIAVAGLAEFQYVGLRKASVAR